MLLIRLSDADRERFGCAEWLELDQNVLSLEEAEQLDDAGIDALRWDRPAEGLVDDAGNPRVSARGVRVAVWLALNRNGSKVSLAELEAVNFRQIAYRRPEPEQGKDPALDDSE